MKRDMELVRKILLEIEDKHVDVGLFSLKIDGYDRKIIAYHCDILHQADLVKDYNAQFAGNELYAFGVGGLTWSGQDYLEKIRNDDIWKQAMMEIEEKKLPKTIDFIAQVVGIISGKVISEMNG